MSAVAIDPYATAAPSGRFLYGLNPLAKLAAPLPAMLVLVFVRDLATPLAFIVLAYAVLLAGARLTARLGLLLVVALPLGAAVIGLGMALWTDASRVDTSVTILQIGGWSLYGGALAVGLATGLRFVAIIALAPVSYTHLTLPTIYSV